MNVLIVGAMYEPDLGPSAPLFTMLSKGLVQRGHHVTVITMVPHYPSGRVSPAFRGKRLWWSVESGVEVLRVGLPSVERQKLAQRFFQYFCYQVGAVFAGHDLRYDVVLAVNPFLTVWLPFVFLGVMRHKPIVYSVNDVYPDVGIALGVFRGKAVIGTAAALEGYCLRHASVVQVISDSFRPALHAMGVSDHRIVVVRNWVDTDLIHPLPRDNSFARQYQLEDKFVVLYAGNLGLSQGLEQVLSVAELLSHCKALRFVFVGDGASRDSLIAEAARRHLTNVEFIPFQSRQHLPEVLATADVSLVTLRQGIGEVSLPSKILSALASGRPVLLSADEETEPCRLITQAKGGVCVPPANPAKLAEAIMDLQQHLKLRDELGRNGRRWVEQYHSPEFAARAFEGLLQRALESPHEAKSMGARAPRRSQ